MGNGLVGMSAVTSMSDVAHCLFLRTDVKTAWMMDGRHGRGPSLWELS